MAENAKPKNNLGPNFRGGRSRKYAHDGNFNVNVAEDSDNTPPAKLKITTHPHNRHMAEIHIDDRILVVRREELLQACGNLELCD